ncbi:hypothetical protein EMCRGX_G029952 [Ephydatia muelleri]|eukprot:Em0010g182a
MAVRCSCSLGEILSEKCDAETVQEVTNDEKRLLHLRTGHNVADICTLHRKVYLQHYSWTQKKCCDPLGHHPTKAVTRSLRVITDKMAERWSTDEVTLVPGNKLCTLCRKSVCHDPSEQEDAGHEDNTYSEGEGIVDDGGDITDQLSALLVNIGESPIDKRKIGHGKRYSEDKMRSIEGSIRKKLKLEPSKVEAEFNEMIHSLKQKFDTSEKFSEKIQILTILPQSWTTRRMEAEFGASYHMAQLSKRLVESDGVMATPNPRQGKALPDAIKQLVVQFYQQDSISRMMPGKKDYVSMVINGTRKHVQKRLLLFNLNDAYKQFKDENGGIKVGLSKFKELRPKNVVLAGAGGTHNVCVCTLHQNVKLMIEGSMIQTLEVFKAQYGTVTYKHLLSSVLCNPALPDCHLGSCLLCSENSLNSCSYCSEDNNDECYFCQKVSNLRKTLLSAFDEQGMDELTYKSWVSVDHTTLITITEPTDVFVESLLHRLLKLKRHDFIAKEQASFLAQLKCDLKEGEAVIQGDFSENYTFIIQDAVQGFHWNNDQATVHPFVVYYNGQSKRVDPLPGIHSLSYVVISDCLAHEAVAVHCFAKKFLGFLNGILKLKKVYYFTDGAAAQYKNKKNFVNLAFHMKDFMIEAEWHFFATAHGKGAPDGIGGTLKRQAARASLQRPLDGQIQTPKQLYEWAKEAILSTTFEYVDKTEVLTEEDLLHERLESSITIEGTHSYHAYYPLDGSTTKLQVKEYSNSLFSEVVKVSDHRDPFHIQSLNSGTYAICIYGDAWWLALVVETFHDRNEAKMKFLHPAGPSPSFSFPIKDDILIMGSTDILMKANPNTPTGRVYHLTCAEAAEASRLLRLKCF